MTLFAFLGGLLFASQAAAAQPPYFYCEATRNVPFGNVTVLQYVATSGNSEAPVTSWFTERGPGGTVTIAFWHDAAEMADRALGGEIVFGWQPPDRSARYRVEVAPVGTPVADSHALRSELQVPSANGIVKLQTHWAPATAMLAGGRDLEIRILDANDAVLRRDTVGAGEFAAALRLAGDIQPEFQAIRADYRRRCRPVDNNGH